MLETRADAIFIIATVCVCCYVHTLLLTRLHLRSRTARVLLAVTSRTSECTDNKRVRCNNAINCLNYRLSFNHEYQ